MKKLFNVLILMSIFIFINNGCKKPDDNSNVMPTTTPTTTPTTITTINDLNGTWEFVNVTTHYGDPQNMKIFTTCESIKNSLDSPFKQSPSMILCSFNFNSTAKTCVLTDICNGTKNCTVRLEDGKIYLVTDAGNNIIYNIQNYNKPILQLWQAYYPPISYILTLKKI
jgi:hypothetical protein